MNKVKQTEALSALLLAQPMSSFADAGVIKMFGVEGSLTLQGDFKWLCVKYSG